MVNSKVEKVLIITPSLNVGGIARHLSVFAESFTRKGMDVTMLSCLNTKSFYNLNEKIKVLRFPADRNSGRLGTFSFYIKLGLYIRKSIIRVNPDFVLVFGEMFNPIVILAAIRTGKPVFIGDMTSANYDYGFLINNLRKLTYPYSAGLVCQTEFVKDYRQREFNNRLNILVLDNPIRQIKEYEVNREKIVLYVGRFAWEKAPDRLIKAFAKIEEKSGWSLWMAGDGPLLGKMRTLVVDLDIENSVKFLGKAENVDELFARSSIYVLPSVLEGFPNALCEAMIAGLPVVCFNGFPSHEIVTNGYDGIILNNSLGAEAIAFCLENLMHNADKRKALGVNAKKIRSRLDPEKVVESFLDFVRFN